MRVNWNGSTSQQDRHRESREANEKLSHSIQPETKTYVITEPQADVKLCLQYK